MRRLLIIIAAVLSLTTAYADGNAFDGGVTYNNAKFGFSVDLPAGFRAQNQDKAMEAERGGKVYIGHGCMVDMVASDKSDMAISIQEALEMDNAFLTIDESQGEKLISKEIKEDEMLAKWSDEYGLRALYVKYVGKTKYEISITYGLNMQQAFDEQVDKIVGSLTTK